MRITILLLLIGGIWCGGSYHIYKCKEESPEEMSCSTSFIESGERYCLNYSLSECKHDDPFYSHDSLDCLSPNSTSTRLICAGEAAGAWRGTLVSCHIYDQLSKSYVFGIYEAASRSIYTNNYVYKMCSVTYTLEWEIFLQCLNSNYEANCYNYDPTLPTRFYCEITDLAEWNIQINGKDKC